MASSERIHARRPVILVILSLLVFVALDNGLFRSGLYSRVTSTKSVAGHFAAVARWCITTTPSQKKDVLVLGHSKIEAALSARIFDEDNPDSHLRIVLGSSGGTTEKMWFYFLKHIDPDRTRYAAIVIPIDTYRTPPLETDCNNQVDVAQFLSPMLDIADWRDLIGTYNNPDIRSKVILGAAVSSHLYATDLQDLLLHPVDRYESLAWAKAAAPTFLYNWDGYDGTLETLELDEKGKIVHAPPQLEHDAFRRGETEARMLKLPKEFVGIWTERYHAFRRQWFTRMIEYYAGSNTKIVFVQVPRWPFDMPALMPIDGAPSITDFVTPSQNVVVLDEKRFEDLEAPRYFYDVLHVNKLARGIFTRRFSKDLRAALDDESR
jgi:hypothetical protein